MASKKGIDAEIDKVLRIMEANPDTPASVAANLLNQARISGDGPLRQKYLRKAQKVIAAIDPHDDPETLQDLQAQVLALQGRGGDTEIAHVTPGEIVIPARMRTPELMATLARAAQTAGVDPRRLVVGNARNAVNPRTGQREFCDVSGSGECNSGGDPESRNAQMAANWQRPPLDQKIYQEPCPPSVLRELFQLRQQAERLKQEIEDWKKKINNPATTPGDRQTAREWLDIAEVSLGKTLGAIDRLEASCEKTV